MPIEPIGVLTILVGCLTLRFSVGFGLTLLTFASLLGSASVVIIPGFANIQPAHATLGFVVLRVMLEPDRVRLFDALRGPSRPGFWFASTVAYGLIGAVFLPRLFQGQLDVYPISGTSTMMRLPLGPAGGNLTQSVYLFSDLICFLAASYGARTERGFLELYRALLVYSVANILFAALDIFTTKTSTTYLMDVIRNAPYVIYVDVAVGDTKRIIGSFTEPAAFAYATLGVFCFSLRLWLGNVASSLTLSVALVSLLLVALATSSTGYVALVPCLVLLYLGAATRLLLRRASDADVRFLLISPCLGVSLVLYLLFDDAVREWVVRLYEALIANKSSSDSGIERKALNMDAFRVFVQTSGFGAGLGSVRASSFVLACLANLGALGSMFYALYIAGTLGMPIGRKSSSVEEHIRAAARISCVGLLVAASVSGALVDLGLPFYILAGLATAPRFSARFPISTTPAQRSVRASQFELSELPARS